MILRLFALLIFSSALTLSAQTGKGSGAWFHRLNPEIEHPPVYQPERGGIALRMDFAKHGIHNPTAVSKIKERVHRVDLVYTRYPYHLNSWEVGYDSLMERRFAELEKILPRAFTDKSVEWHLVLQNDCNSLVEAREMFHGFCIFSGPEDRTATEIKAVERPLIEPVEEIEESDIESTEIAHKEDLYLPPPSRFDSVDLVKNYQTAVSIFTGEREFYDSTSQWVLERHPKWGKKVLIIDWTASMYRHGAHVLHWLEQVEADKDVLGIVFFNDGDNKWDNEKEVGNTGGLYTVDGFDRDSILATMEKVSFGGSGGDHRENDLEAVLEAMDRFPEASEYILIADNSGPVRDMQLLKQIDRPLRVVLCGVYHDEYETDYLNIAHKTGGSLHTRDQDLTDLEKIKPFQTLEFDEATYILVQGRFKKVKQ